MIKSSDPLIYVLVLTLCACASSGPDPGAPTVHDERLHALMAGALDSQFARLEALGFELHLTPAELDRLRMQRARAIATAAADLGTSASAILALQPTLDLDADARVRFAALAQQLQDSADTLHEQASAGDLQGLAPALRRLGSTCDSCHELYRGP